jgi:prepilin-type N-terminal cleavage/methylation domain-containing protein
MKIVRTIDARSKKGFTLIEIVLAVVVIGILIAIIVPRAQRANVEAKYTGVRQAATEIGRWGMDWAVRNLESQDILATCNLDNYIGTLVGYVGDGETGTTRPNWLVVNDNLDGGGNCRAAVIPAENRLINYSVSDIIPIDSHPRNPFNGLSYFNIEGGNGSSRLQPGILYLGVVEFEEANHYYFVYTGTDSNAIDEWHAGMGQGTSPNLSYAQLRNGIFMARQVP